MKKFLDWSTLKAFIDDKINVNQKLKFDLRRMEKIVGKRRKCWFFFSLKFSFLGSLKASIMWKKVTGN